MTPEKSTKCFKKRAPGDNLCKTLGSGSLNGNGNGNEFI